MAQNCFSAFTSSTNLSNLSSQNNKENMLSSPSSSRAPRKTFNFKELCVFCGQKSYKKDKKLLLVSTFELGETLNPIRPGLFSHSPGPRGGGLRGLDAKNQG